MTTEKTVTCDRCGTSVALARTHVSGDLDEPTEVEVVCVDCVTPKGRFT